MADNESHLRFTFQYNRNELEQARRTIVQMRSELLDWAKAERTLAAEAKQAESVLRSSFSGAASAGVSRLRTLIQSGEELGDVFRRDAEFVATLRKEIDGLSTANTGGGRGAGLNAAGRGLTAVAGVLGNVSPELASVVRGIEDVVQVAETAPEVLDAMKGSIGTLVTTIGPAVVIVGGLALALQRFNQIAEEARSQQEQANQAAVREAGIRFDIQKLTTEEAQQRSVAALEEVQRAQARLDALRAIQSDTQQELDQLLLKPFTERSSQDFAREIELRNALAQSEKDIADLTANELLPAQEQYRIITAALINNQFAVNDAMSFFTDTLEKLPGALAGGIQGIQEVLEQGKRDREIAGAWLREFFGNLSPLSAALKAGAESVAEFAQATKAMADEQRRHADVLDQIIAERDAAESKARADAAEDSAEAVAKAEQDKINAAIKAQQELLRLEAEHRLKVHQIIRNANRSIKQAESDRNVVAADQAKQAQKDALDDEQAAFKLRQNEINQAYKNEIRLIDQRLVEQQRAIDKRLRQQIAQAAEAAHRALQIENEKHTREMAIRKAALEQVTGITTQGANNVTAITGKMWKTIQDQGLALLAALSGSTSSSSTKSSTKTAAKTASTVSSFGAAAGGALSGFLGAAPIATAAGFTFAPVINATSKAAIKKQVNEQLERMFSQIGA